MIRVHKQEQVRIAALFSSPGELYKQEGGSVWRSHFVLPDKDKPVSTAPKLML